MKEFSIRSLEHFPKDGLSLLHVSLLVLVHLIRNCWRNGWAYLTSTPRSLAAFEGRILEVLRCLNSICHSNEQPNNESRNIIDKRNRIFWALPSVFEEIYRICSKKKKKSNVCKFDLSGSSIQQHHETGKMRELYSCLVHKANEL